MIIIYDCQFLFPLATIIDRYWLVTSKRCCLNSDSFTVIFDDEKKSQYIFSQKKKQTKCVEKQFCSKMHPRNDKEIENVIFCIVCIGWIPEIGIGITFLGDRFLYLKNLKMIQ